MNVLVFGASGRTGRWIVEDAVAKGHRVTAFMRRRPKYCGGLDGSRILLGDVMQPKSIEAAVVGQDAVLWCVAPRTREASSRLVSVGTTNVLWAMQRAGSRLLVCASAFGVGDSRWGGPYARLLRRVLGPRVLDMERQEEAIRGSGVEWVIVRPTLLTNGRRTESYRVGTDLRLGLLPRISRADVAHFMMRQLAEPTFRRQTVAVTG